MLPVEVQTLIDDLYGIVEQDADHRLAPIHRKRVYDTIRLLEPERCVAIRGRLAVLAARKVLPLWQAARPDDLLLDRVLLLAEMVLTYGEKSFQAEYEYRQAWGTLERLGTNADETMIGAFCAAEAARVTLGEALGIDPFEGIMFFRLGGRDEDELDPWCSDTAMEAAASYAGNWNGPRERHREFWTWWLRRALPLAWQQQS